MFHSIESAIQDIRDGKIIIVVDDEDRENEGDFICAAAAITPEIVNFMSKHGRGLICVPLPEEHCDELGLDLMVSNNTALHETAFTVSVDLLGHGCTTGISAHDRSKTIHALIDPFINPLELGRPGHIFPLRAKKGGVLRRAGHTEASVDLARLAGFPAPYGGVLVEIMNDDGSMARLPELMEVAKKFDFKIISIKDLIEYRIKRDSLIEEIVRVEMPTKHGNFKLVAFKDKHSNNEHLAMIKGEWEKDEPVLTRVHSSCFTGDILGSLRCDCGEQLEKAMEMVEKEGKGIILYMNQEGRGIGLLNKLKAYRLQEEGMDTVEANLHLGFQMDQRDYGIGAQILRHLNVTKLRLMSNNPRKRVGLVGYGLEVVENVPIAVCPNPHNERYLRTKKEKLGHEL
ncbi:MAG: bifunctional 3,4-dihydroxy-2-butanone 4-phosphate synthase/GTP cyclohydrolase II [Sphingobacteriales bacterium SCN 48-20]|jgi:3,4-dihydroxy 2-butanone 4-phosphate synthase/GTP cyclohydrolase II|uniref:bifunctional 3,4-dihydroxy-2-butanone-4-phosphate synthase/GTP cyclohydrolase II n=1 Tax=Terrimonas ferruginea TaxID=249 RepID=UPI00086E7220|nr:bifunctional 3,4-dihydroxy-2-butanone-4-phosphate synthase/GTP cyclohydrolase II [Terrimonas ferruginea]MBN8783922.1 bifunctional 3,4-dihydroxy-2-butanone-4-phosphate synthase/GTP cyclohydrolase II [Terrimonas ferruginea]ODT92682.1 MAG: bifunctional 3,4-dihydroxy-2-butanone 4-phosphate synthase/GTP cyclohydrolase II [Sphingobacteriales bacterium SCN 48-20]OJW41766.1 MAG: bifunctional 3,4-dihydroxy-2-butanone 4-phosphate synthase/GTP cyclohydrolase II [Sphingobacteriales bacterium 48-107]